jgi:Leucine-rich repeat (LRR) protein
MNNFKELTDFLDKYDVKYIIHSDCVKVEGDLYLHNNNLTSLPESFGNLKIGGNLWLDGNKLEYLPKSFGNLKIGFSLWLYNNQLTSLPESFGNLKIGGCLWLDGNNLTSLPESFGNLKIGGGLWLDGNNLTSLPESFGNLKIGGNLNLSDNKLEYLPYILAMKQTIKEDWCYVDGIVREIVSKKKLKDLSVIKTPFDFIVGKNTTWAHGRTIEEATQDYHFKQMKVNPDALKDIDLDKPLSHEEAINVYRNVTRACREGIRQWMSGKTFPEQITIREIINLTQSAYGGKEFKKFFLP